ncbi:hypothetical protein BX661DRAFT_188631 [Kickxella alabastrina]|uniref:uncharacterized protein n=1 Tax=Kickxella alabastrina TaxID=61397 RepID=UPI0022209EF3|nr:uncharacterized protein BX661DRAFT_190314 [Kickxella alabastrina]XP_051388884.1 uncharacterized protein BX661DRAFT_188631 [Kickxella alabastrina]KAI7819463.1 hypothetical protein BX661DRAFT_190314 [Kickxella alabastrina]KAI7821122.1 hypothetical protein BX661DRAFT_188631 [Kickxella alabastrina]
MRSNASSISQSGARKSMSRISLALILEHSTRPLTPASLAASTYATLDAPQRCSLTGGTTMTTSALRYTSTILLASSTHSWMTSAPSFLSNLINLFSS